MMNWIATPLKGANGVLFGNTRDEVRNILGLDYTEFKKSTLSKNTTDDFGVCHVFYDEQNMCKAVEVFEDIKVEIDRTVIFPVELDILKAVVPDLEEVDEGSYVSKNFSIGVYAPSGKMESILFAGNGYF